MANFQIIVKRGDIPFTISAGEIDRCIREHCCSGEIRWTEYLYDEAGDVCGLRGSADLGRGYGFNYGWREFTIKMGETYSFTSSFTSIDGPSDWSEDSFEVTLKMVRI